MTKYIEFASLYDELMNDFDYKSWADYIEDLFKKHNKNPKNILEMACGTGNLTIHLAKRNYNIVGFDLSSHMLTRAYEKLIKHNNVKLLQLDMRNFKFSKKFDSIISICDSVNYITSNEDLLSTFQNVYNHLETDGIFIFDINSFYKLKTIIGNNTFVEDRDNIFYTWQNYFDEESNLCSFYLTFFVSENGETYYRYDEEHIEKAYKEEYVANLLKEVGFTTVEYYNAFSFDKVKEDTERINFIAIK